MIRIFSLLSIQLLPEVSGETALSLVQRNVQFRHGEVVYSDHPRRYAGDPALEARAKLMAGTRTVTDAPTTAPAATTTAAAAAAADPADTTEAPDAPTALPPGLVTGAPHNAAEASGVAGNGPLDGYAFITATIVNSIMIVIFVVIFMVLRGYYPQKYEANLAWDENGKYVGSAPTQALGDDPNDRQTIEKNLHDTFGWWTASTCTTTEQIADSAGLDQAMLLEFCNLGMNMLWYIGVPMCLIIGPMNCAFGGQPAWAIGDYLSSLSFGNVEHGSWLYWVHAFVVWYVVYIVQTQLYNAQKNFLELRFSWLHKMDPKRSNTVLVEGIPETHRKEGDLQKFFEHIFEKENVKNAYVVRNTVELDPLVAAKESAEMELTKHNITWEKEKKKAQPGADESLCRPKNWKGDDLINLAEAQIQQAQEAIDAHRADVKKTKQKEEQEESAGYLGAVNLGAAPIPAFDDVCEPGDLTWTGFVEFHERKYAQMAVSQLYSEDKDTWMVSNPPEPNDIIWKDLQLSPKKGTAQTVFGYCAVGGLYVAYLPVVIGIAQAAVAVDAGPLEAVWIGLAPTLGLQVMVAFLPTILLLIFRTFWILKADTLAQKRLQTYYFAFQIVFVVLVTAIGSDAIGFTMTVFTDPLALPDLLGETMPPATHFYMNFLVLQWVTHGQAMMRHVQLGKYLSFQQIMPEEDALRMSEPEDQDYYGMGSRCARFTINMVIGIVYGTLCPPMNFLCWVNFKCCRVFYGYLIPFAETKKPDLGGIYWVDMLKHLFIANIIYCIVMCGVLSQRAEMSGFQPVTIAAPSLIYVVYKYNRFERAFSWEELPIPELLDKAEKYKDLRRTLDGDYVQKNSYD